MKGNSKKVGLILAMVLLGIGFATLTAALTVNGTVKVKGNIDDFDIKFAYGYSKGTVVVNGMSYDTNDPEIQNNGKDLVYSPNKKTMVAGDYYDITYQIVNRSVMYDASVTISCTDSSGASLKIFTFDSANSTTTIANISAQSTGEGKLRFKLNQELSTDASEAFKCTFTATAKSRTTVATRTIS